MSCVIKFQATDCDIDAIAASLKLDVQELHRQGEARFPKSKHFYRTSGFIVIASEAGFDEFKQQLLETTEFIRANQQALQQLGDIAKSRPDCDFYFDFGINTRMFDVAVQIDTFPADLIQLIASVNAELVLSQFPPSNNEDDKSDD